MAAIIEEIAKFIFWLIFEVVITWTGEIVLSVLTFGKHKPRWDLYTKESPVRFIIFSEISFWIGLAVWIFLIAVIYEQSSFLQS
jgi:hypothetical protein